MLKDIKNEIVARSYAGELDGGAPTVEEAFLIVFAATAGMFLLVTFWPVLQNAFTNVGDKLTASLSTGLAGKGGIS